MKKFLIITFAICFCIALSVSTFAASTYEITDKQILNNFETGDPLENMHGGSTAWGAHWIETIITKTEGLEGKTALKLDFNESPEGTIGGFQSNSIGITQELNDWTSGAALLYRVKNISDSSINVATTIDVNDDNPEGRSRLWQDGTQIMLNTSFAPVDTVYAEALSKDNVTKTEGRKLYVTIPAGFDGYLLWDLSNFTTDVEQHYESILTNGLPDNCLKEVKDFVLLIQDCQKKSLIIDDFRLVDYSLVEEVVEIAAPAEISVPAEVVENSVVEIVESPKTYDNGIMILLLLCFASGAVIINKNRVGNVK